jgi:hypothetical protein
MRRHLAALALALVCAAPASALAAPCAGFTDVPDTSQFCTNVEWLKNRAITLGCSSTTLYCPGDPVTRLAMAAFMNRLATALAPAIYAGAQNAFSSSGTLIAPDQICQTAPIPVTDFPRVATARAVLTANVGATARDIATKIYYTSDNGANWQQAANFWTEGTLDVIPGATLPPRVTVPSITGAVDLAVGKSYRFALAAARTIGSGSVLVSCNLFVRVENRNGTSSPYDGDLAEGAGPAGGN